MNVLLFAGLCLLFIVAGFFELVGIAITIGFIKFYRRAKKSFKHPAQVYVGGKRVEPVDVFVRRTEEERARRKHEKQLQYPKPSRSAGYDPERFGDKPHITMTKEEFEKLVPEDVRERIDGELNDNSPKRGNL